MMHIIQRQHFDVDVKGTEQEGLMLLNRLPDWSRDYLEPAIERLLDRCAPANGQLTIEYLEIDAGTLTFEQFEHDLTEAVTQALEQALRERMSARDMPAVTQDDDPVLHKSTFQGINEAFIYFLKSGRLPWSFRLPEGKTLEQTILDSWQTETQSAAVVRSLDASILQALASETSCKRLTYQFSTIFIETLLARLAPEENFARVLENRWLQITKKAPVDRSLQAESEPSVFTVAKHNLTDIGDRAEAPETSLTKTGGHSFIKEGLYTDQAGLVVLHPFLSRLFEALGVAAGDKLLQPDRAICLLHYLATGQTAVPEYELILPKILCNFPLEAPVESKLELTVQEREESDGLLEAVIHHWDALRNTSADGLRGSFLVRLGKVSLLDDGYWVLQVEPKSYDILLDQLPWGVGMIKLPWMDKLMRVQWR